MLTCVHHPLDPMRVVEEDEAQRLKETGVWFDCPAKAKKYHDNVVEQIKNELPTAKRKGHKNER